MSTKKTITYTEAIAEIEMILEQLDKNELDVDELGEKVKKVAMLVSMCKEKLHNTELEIDKILKDMESK